MNRAPRAAPGGTLIAVYPSVAAAPACATTEQAGATQVRRAPADKTLLPFLPFPAHRSEHNPCPTQHIHPSAPALEKTCYASALV